MSAISESYECVASSTRIRLARNFADFPFPGRLMRDAHAVEQALEMERLVTEALSKVEEFTLYKMRGLSEERAALLVEQNLISRDLLRHRPIASALVSHDKIISIMLNEEDHVREQYFMQGFDLAKAYERIMGLDDAIGESIPFAYDETFGYLTACPTNMGAGMRASFMVFVPALTLTGALGSVINTLPKFGVTARGVYGEGSEAKGFMYQISNQATIGAGEEEILGRITKVAESFIRAERAAREDLGRRGGIDLKDKIMRAYGILSNACKISSDEFMELIAYVKLGISMELVKADADKADELITLTQPAMLCKAAGKKLNAEERDMTRARIVKNALAR